MTDIEWTNEVWNFLRGCSRDNVECDRCYAMTLSHRNLLAADAGLTKLRPKDSARPGVDWTGKIAVMPERLALPLRWKKPRKVFVNSMSDLFHPGVPFEVIAAAFGVMAATPRHTYQVLTKRPQRASEFFAWLLANGGSEGREVEMCVGLLENMEVVENWDRVRVPIAGTWPLPNVHLGVSAGRQETAEAKIPMLLQLPAAVRWVSAEPLLGPINFTGLRYDGRFDAEGSDILNALSGVSYWSDGDVGRGGLPRLDWIVVGGESGTRARPCEIGWIRDIVKQCREAHVPAFVKQLGSNATGFDGMRQFLDLNDTKGGDPSEWPEDLRVRQWPA